MNTAPPINDPHPHGVVIVGAGFAGIGMAIQLLQAGLDDFVVLEQASEIGGTWRDNTYPGCACDIPAALYSFSFAPAGDWSRRYPSQAEIQRYLLDCVDRFGVRLHLHLGTALAEATYDAPAGLWHLRTQAGDTLTARVLVLAPGTLHHPALPAIPGLERFGGPAFHSARWDHAVGFAGKRVAVIGTGASAIQIVPELAKQAAALTLFQRTPAWVLPKHDPIAGPARKALLRAAPWLRRVERSWVYWSHEVKAVGFVVAPRLMRAVERRARSHAKGQVKDTALRERLTPDYQIGCKRVLLSNDFLPALDQPHVDLVTTPIARVEPDGIVTDDGVSHPADILVFATGFQATQPLGSLRVTGSGGGSLADAWQGGMQAWMGMAVPGFPNLFLLGGPNTGLGHNSIVFMLEAQIEHVLRTLRRMRQNGTETVEIRGDIAQRFNAWLDARMRRTVWLSGCRSWYLDSTGRNTTLWPGFSLGFWFRNKFARGNVWREQGFVTQQDAAMPPPSRPAGSSRPQP